MELSIRVQGHTVRKGEGKSGLHDAKDMETYTLFYHLPQTSFVIFVVDACLFVLVLKSRPQN